MSVRVDASMLDFTEYTKFLIGLLAIVDPLGAVPIFITLTAHQTYEQRQKTVNLTVVSVFVALVVALLFGEWILWAFGISMDAFRTAGGLVLLMMGLSMLKSHGAGTDLLEHAPQDETLALIPLTMPLLARPGAMSTVIVYAHKSGSPLHYLMITLVILIIGISLWLCLRMLPWLSRHLSVRSIMVSTRIMGILLVSIAMEFIAGGLRGLFPSLNG